MRKLRSQWRITQIKLSVSVPLRGLDMRKLEVWDIVQTDDGVSVPLRGLDMRKLSARLAIFVVRVLFQSPCGD